MQRAQGLDGSPGASSGWPAEEVSEPVLVGGLGRTGFHIEKITSATAIQPKASIDASTKVVPPLLSIT